MVNNSVVTTPSVASAKALLKSESGSLVISSLDVAVEVFDQEHVAEVLIVFGSFRGP